jgi:hypothetical protein
VIVFIVLLSLDRYPGIFLSLLGHKNSVVHFASLLSFSAAYGRERLGLLLTKSFNLLMFLRRCSKHVSAAEKDRSTAERKVCDPF